MRRSSFVTAMGARSRVHCSHGRFSKVGLTSLSDYQVISPLVCRHSTDLAPKINRYNEMVAVERRANDVDMVGCVECTSNGACPVGVSDSGLSPGLSVRGPGAQPGPPALTGSGRSVARWLAVRPALCEIISPLSVHTLRLACLRGLARLAREPRQPASRAPRPRVVRACELVW